MYKWHAAAERQWSRFTGSCVLSAVTRMCPAVKSLWQPRCVEDNSRQYVDQVSLK